MLDFAEQQKDQHTLNPEVVCSNLDEQHTTYFKTQYHFITYNVLGPSEAILTTGKTNVLRTSYKNANMVLALMEKQHE